MDSRKIASNPYTGPYQPFDQEFHIIMNLAVAGGFFPPTYGPFIPENDTKTWASDFEIDYVRIYQNPLDIPTDLDSPSSVPYWSYWPYALIALLGLIVLIESFFLFCRNLRSGYIQVDEDDIRLKK
jgi:hypothetical protein